MLRRRERHCFYWIKFFHIYRTPWRSECSKRQQQQKDTQGRHLTLATGHMPVIFSCGCYVYLDTGIQSLFGSKTWSKTVVNGWRVTAAPPMNRRLQLVTVGVQFCSWLSRLWTEVQFCCWSSFQIATLSLESLWVMFGIVNIHGHSRDIRLPTSMWRYTFRCDLKTIWSSFMVYCLAVILTWLLCYTSSGKIKCVLLTMQSLFKIIGMFLSYWFLSWLPLLVWKSNLSPMKCGYTSNWYFVWLVIL